MKKFFHIVILSSLLLTGCYDDLRDKEQVRLDDLKGVEIASVESQINAINSSIASINSMSSEIGTYIDRLQQTNAELTAHIAALNSALESAKSELQNNIDASKAGTLAELQNVRNALEAKLSEINTVIALLQAKKESLDSRLDQLRSYADGSLVSPDWVEATMVHLEDQKAFQEDVAAIKALVDTLSASLIATENEINERLGLKLSEVSASLDPALKNKVDELAEAYRNAIAQARKDVLDAYDKNVAAAIEKCKEGLRSWISDQLADYYPLAEAEAQILALKAFLGNESGKDSAQEQIDALLLEISALKQKLIDDYTAIIESAIEQSGADMDQAILAKVNEIKADVAQVSAKVDEADGEIRKLLAKVDELGSTINGLDRQVSGIKESIAAISGIEGGLEGYIATVRDILTNSDTEHYNAVFAKVEALQKTAESLQKQLDDLKAYVGTIPQEILDEGITSVVDWVKYSKENIEKSFKLYFTVTDIEQYQSDIEKLLEADGIRIIGIGAKMDTFLTDSKKTIEGWIDARIAPYYKAEVIDNKISDLKTALELLIDTKDSEVLKDIEALQKDFDGKLDQFGKDYAAVISKAITDNAGVVTETIKTATDAAFYEIQTLDGRIGTIGDDIDEIRTDLNQIKSDIAGITSDLAKLQAFINNSDYKSLQAYADYIEGVLDGCSSTYATAAQLDALMKTIYGDDLTGNTSGLRYDAARIIGLTSRMESVESQIDGLEKFFEGYGDTDNLKSILDGISSTISDIRDGTDVVAGKFDGKQDAIDEYCVMLFGPNMKPDEDCEEDDRDDESSNCVWYRLKDLTTRIMYCTFRSITYIPSSYADGIFRVTKNGGTWSMTVDFMIRPANLVSILDEKNCHLLLYRMDGAAPHSFENDYSKGSISITNKNVSEGTFSLYVSFDNGHKDFTPSSLGECYFVLYFDAFGNDPDYGFFTSPYIPVVAEKN